MKIIVENSVTNNLPDNVDKKKGFNEPLKESVNDYEVKQVTFDVAVKSGTDLSAGQGAGNRKFFTALSNFLESQGMEMAGDLIDSHDVTKTYQDNDYEFFNESLKEDTVQKSNGKWTNRGDDGTEHGEFDTKAEADAQRKAMYASGYKGESLSHEEVNPLDIAQMHFETGVNFDRNDFSDDEEYDEYLGYVEMGPEGFCEEFSDVLDLDPDFVSEYSSEH